MGDSLRSLYFTSLETGWLVAWQLSSVCVCVRMRVRVCVCVRWDGGRVWGNDTEYIKSMQDSK